MTVGKNATGKMPQEQMPLINGKNVTIFFFKTVNSEINYFIVCLAFLFFLK